MEEYRQLEEKQRLKRLHHLLNKSNLYAKFLLDRMEKQMAEEKEMLQRPGRKVLLLCNVNSYGSRNEICWGKKDVQVECVVEFSFEDSICELASTLLSLHHLNLKV